VEQAIVLSGPGFNYNFIAQLPLGFKLEVIGQSENAGWIVVRLAGGAEGWIPAENITILNDPVPLAVIVPPSPPPASSTPQPVPMVFLNPASGPPGVHFSMTYSGFTPHDHPVLVVTRLSTGSVVYESRLFSVSGNGTSTMHFRGTIQIEPGEYIFKVTGSDGKSASATFTIIEPNE
jgi:hypothetical protein